MVKNRHFSNPEGIESVSPGLAAPADYPGKTGKSNDNPEGIAAKTAIQPRWGRKCYWGD
jgi:hypothetical protein